MKLPRAMTEEEIDFHVVGIVLAQQQSLKKGLRLFSKQGEKAVEKELSQLHAMNMYKPSIVSKLSQDEKREVQEPLLFITKKRDTLVKARKFANVSKQRTYDGYKK